MMKKIPKQEYTVEFMEQAVKHEKMGKLIDLVANINLIGLVQTSIEFFEKMVGKVSFNGEFLLCYIRKYTTGALGVRAAGHSLNQANINLVWLAENGIIFDPLHYQPIG